MSPRHDLIPELMQLPIFHAEWVLWLLLGLSVLSVSVILERAVFFLRRRTDLARIHRQLEARLDDRDLSGALALLARSDAFETRVAKAGLHEFGRGSIAARLAMEGETAIQSLRFGRGLGLLATVGSNAPFIGLFGTVLGIIKAFRELATDLGQASTSVMGGISEALVATAVGLLVAIPAVLAFNALSGRLAELQSRAQFLQSAVLVGLAEEEG